MLRYVFVIVLLLSTSLLAGDVVKVANRYEDGGGYNKTWKGSGTPKEILHRGERILARGDGTYCCGFTFTVAMDIAHQRGLLNEATAVQVRKFQKNWYGANDDSAETQCVFAAERLGIGSGVSLADAQPGDFIQFWRTNKSGHSVVLLELANKGDEIVGIRYRSSQGSTDGIGNVTEYFADAPGRAKGIVRERTYVCRLDCED